MYTLTSNITILDPAGNLIVEKLPVIECKIKKSRLSLTDTATITLPRNIKLSKDAKLVNINDIIKRDSKVTIQLGYDGNLVTRFTGFVSKVSAEIPFTINCQDTMFPLKQNNFTHTWEKGVTIRDIVTYIYPGPIFVADLAIGGYVAKNQSTAQILDDLKKFGLQCYFALDAKGVNTLYVDFPGVLHDNSKQVNYDFSKNIIDNKLEYKLATDFKIQIKGTSTNDKGEVITINAPDDVTDTGDTGEVLSLDYYNMDKDHLQKIVTSEINALSYDGLRGSFTTWGLPVIEPGDTAVLKDPKYPEEHKGSYLTESVEITFGVNGYRQEPEMERKLA
jgi:hypothetical protein